MSEPNTRLDDLLKELGQDFITFQQSKNGSRKIVYPQELRARVGAAIAAGAMPDALASECRISISAVRSWAAPTQKVDSGPRVAKRLRVVRPAQSGEVSVFVSTRLKIGIPVSAFNLELLREILLLGREL